MINATVRQIAQVLAAKRLRGDYCRTFGSPQGGRVLRDLMKRNHVFDPTINANSHITGFHEGRRTAVLEILKTMNWSEADIQRMVETTEDDDVLEDD